MTPEDALRTALDEIEKYAPDAMTRERARLALASSRPEPLDVDRLRAALIYGIERQLGPGSAIEFDSAIGSAIAEYDRLGDKG